MLQPEILSLVHEDGDHYKITVRMNMPINTTFKLSTNGSNGEQQLLKAEQTQDPDQPAGPVTKDLLFKRVEGCNQVKVVAYDGNDEEGEDIYDFPI